VITLPVIPEVDDKLLMIGVGGETVNGTALLVAVVETFPLYTAALLRYSTTLPVVAPLGTVTTTDVSPQELAVAVLPLNETKLKPWYCPSPAPATVTVVPTCPEFGDRPLITGVTTVKAAALLDVPFAVTMMLPVGAP
jgi:hypothetical protein